MGARLKFWRRSRLPKRGSRDEAVVFLAAPPSNLTRLYYNGSATKSHTTTTQYCQLGRLKQEGNDLGDMEEWKGIVAGISMTGVSADCSAVKEG